MSAAPERKDFAAIKQMKQVMGKHFGDLAQGPAGREKDGLVYECGAG